MKSSEVTMKEITYRCDPGAHFVFYTIPSSSSITLSSVVHVTTITVSTPRDGLQGISLSVRFLLLSFNSHLFHSFTSQIVPSCLYIFSGNVQVDGRQTQNLSQSFSSMARDNVQATCCLSWRRIPWAKLEFPSLMDSLAGGISYPHHYWLNDRDNYIDMCV